MSTLYDRLVNRMVWLSEQNGNEDEAEERMLHFEPFVTVSRDPGSGGKPIAKLLAKRLGYTFYDKSLIASIAKSTDARKEILAKVDEKERSIMEDLVHSVLNPEYISERRYIKHLMKVVLRLAQEKKVVFLGRGTNFILPNSYGLHVRITAPYRVCVSRAVQFENVPYKKARKIIKKVTEERAGFVKQYFGKDITNPKYYDLTLNTTYMSLEDAVDIIKTALDKKLASH